MKGRRMLLLGVGRGGRYDADALAIFAAFATPPNGTRKGLINTCVRTLKSAGVWSKLDCLYMFAAADSQGALINWKAPGTFDATAVNSPTFTADEGFTGNGNSSYVSSNYNPSTSAISYARDSASFGLWSLTAGVNAAREGGYAPGADGTMIDVRFTGDLFITRVNGTASLDSAEGVGTGLFAADRASSNAHKSYKNGSLVGTNNSSASAAILNGAFRFLNTNSATFSARKLACGFVGGSLSSGEHATLHSALQVYLQGVGAV